MKKTYDWSVRLSINLSNNQRKIQIVSSVHTNIHQLKIQICKILDLPVLDTHIELHHRGSHPLKATSTLLQNDITTNSCLTATVVRTKPVVRLPIEEQKGKNFNSSSKKKDKQNVDNVGLSIVSSCTNPTCVNYNQNVEINYGFGDFHILELTAFAKCEVCPYKSQFLRPNMLSHEIKVERCYYQLKGTALNSCGIPIPHKLGYLKSQGPKQIHKLLSDNPWHIGMQLLIKPL